MNIKLLNEHNLEFLRLKEGYTGSSEFIHVKMPHWWKSHVTAHLCVHASTAGSLLQAESGGSLLKPETGTSKAQKSTWTNVFKKLKMMAPYVWPKGSLWRQLIVLACLIILGAGRGINLLVPLYSKYIGKYIDFHYFVW